jgi:hypothetical protein
VPAIRAGEVRRLNEFRLFRVSNNQDPARQIAERIARRLAGPSNVSQSLQGPTNGAESAQKPGARVINFISTAPPARTQPSIGAQAERQSTRTEAPATFVPQVAQSPWLAPFSRANTNPSAQPADHPSQERFGVEEAVVSELVEFFENEKQCSVDPSGKPCDHCAMCSSRGF